MLSSHPAFSEAAYSAASFLKEHDNFLLLTHAHPDGDTVGSAFALAMALREYGKTAYVLPDPLSRKDFLPYFASVAPEGDLPSDPTLVTVDVADGALLPEWSVKYLPEVKCVIDHHTSNRVDCALKCVDSKAAATAEIIFEIVHLLDLPLSATVAGGIYMALMTDTGCFKYSNVRPQTLLYASEALAAGADAFGLARKLFMKKAPARMKVESHVIAGFRYFAEGKITMASISLAEIAAMNAIEDDIGGLASLTVIPETTEIGIFLREMAPDEVKVSVRTDTYVDAAALCAKFGGGGHVRAAGCTLKNTTLEEAFTLIREEAEKSLSC